MYILVKKKKSTAIFYMPCKILFEMSGQKKSHFPCHFTSSRIIASSLRISVLDRNHNDINYHICERHCGSSGLLIIENFLDLYMLHFCCAF